MQLTKFLFWLVVPALVWPDAYAQSNTLSISPGIRFFDYAEYDDNGAFLDGEKGPVLGVGGAFEHHDKNDSVISVFGEVFTGTVDYDGQLQSGFPLTTDTDELFYSLGIGIKTPITSLNNQVNVFFDIGYQVWERDILATPISTELFEVYKWWELSLGAEYFIIKENAKKLSIFGRAYQIFNPTMEVDLVSEGYGKPTLDLGEHIGGEIGFQKVISYASKHQIAFLGTYKFWQFGRSNDVTVIRNDNLASIVIHEPRSETNNITFQIVFTTTL